MAQKKQSGFITVVRLIGALIFLVVLAPPSFKEPITFGIYLIATVVLSIVKIKLPGVTSSVSLNTIPMLLGAAELSSSEAVVIGVIGTLVQSFWHAKRRPSWLRLSFNLAVITIAIDSSGVVYRAALGFHSVGQSVAFAALALTFFTMDTLPVCMAIALTERHRVVEVWKEVYASSFHLFMMGAAVAGILTISGESKWVVSVAVLPIFYLMYRAYWLFLAKMQQEKNLTVESASLNLRTIEALVAMMQARDGGTDDESRLIQTYAVEIAKQLQLPDEEQKALEFAAPLRDIGKMAIPDHLLSKPGQLTPAEMDRVKKHVTIGAEILTRVSFPFPVVPIVRGHHERWDGTGYPDGLTAEKIPAGARVLAAVDALVSMTSERPYRRALSFDQAMGVILSGASRSFDPAVVSILEARSEELRGALEKIKHEPAQPLAEFASLEAYEGAQPESKTSDALQSITQARREDKVFAGTEGFLNLKESLSVFAMRLNRVVTFDTVAVFSQVGERLIPEYVNGDESKVLGAGELAVGTGLTGKVAENGKAVLNGNPDYDFSFLQPHYESNLKSAISVPIESALGRRGVLTLYATQKDFFTKEDLRVLLTVRLKVLDWELHSLATTTLLSTTPSIGAQLESAAVSLSNA